MSDSQQVRNDILRFLKKQSSPVSASKVAQSLKRPTSEIREAIWGLTAASEAEITEDWKLKRSEGPVAEPVEQPA